MIIKNIKIWVLVVLMTIFFACEKVIDMDIENKAPSLVLNCFMNPDSLFQISVTRSIPILENETIMYVNNATVKIFEGDNLLETLTYNENTQTYKSNILKPAPGINYRIEVSAPNYTTAICETAIPLPVSIASIDTFSRSSYNSEFNSYYDNFVIKVNLSDPGNEENYYLMRIESQDFNPLSPHNTYYGFMIKNILIELYSYDLFLNFQQAQNDNGIGLSNNQNNYIWATYIAFSDIAFNGKNTSFELEINNYIIKDSIDVNLISVSKDYYKYITSEALYSNSGDPFTEKVQMYCNIRNGMGIVFASSSSSKSIIRKRIATTYQY